MREIYADEIGKIRHTNLEYLGKRKIRISDLDENGHVYNGQYADMVCDFMSQTDYEKDINKFRINYVCEAVLGEVISIYSEEIENGRIFVGKCNEKTCFECEFMWK